MNDDATQNLNELITPSHALPEFKGWTVAADFAHIIASHVIDKKPNLVMELGSGLSTLVIGHALKKAGKGKLISVDHDERFFRKTQAAIEEHGLQDVVELWYCPLGPCHAGDKQQPWYQLPYDKLPDHGIDLLIVDGPPQKTCSMARYPAVPKLWDKLSEHATIMLDDAERGDERDSVQQWVKDLAVLRHEYRATKKGTSILQR